LAGKVFFWDEKGGVQAFVGFCGEKHGRAAPPSYGKGQSSEKGCTWTKTIAHAIATPKKKERRQPLLARGGKGEKAQRSKRERTRNPFEEEKHQVPDGECAGGARDNILQERRRAEAAKLRK